MSPRLEPAPGPALAPLRLVALKPFPGPGGAPGPRIRAGVLRSRGLLALRYVAEWLPDGARLVGSTRASVRADRLWERTCFEAFVGPAGRPCYWEVNLAPDGAWNVFRFAGYRQGMTPETRVDAPVAFAALPAPAAGGAGTLTIEATIDVGRIPDLVRVPLRIGLAAVLVAAGDAPRYFALHHPAARPDFHRPEGFAVHLAEDGA